MRKIFGIYTDKILYKKLLFEYEKECIDEWGIDEPKYKFQFYFRVYRCFCLQGWYYQVRIPDMISTNKNLFIAINNCLVHMNDDSPRYYRLKETLLKQDKWKTLE